MNERSINGGYSLLELLMYLAILVVVAIALVSSFIPLARSYSSAMVATSINQSATVAIERLVQEVRRANDVNAGSVLGTSPGTLVLDTTTSVGSPVTLTFAVANGVLTVQEGAGAAAPLTGGTVTVDTFRVLVSTNATSSKTVQVELTLSSIRGVVTKANTFEAEATLRNMY